jgi:hypothetical protein
LQVVTKDAEEILDSVIGPLHLLTQTRAWEFCPDLALENLPLMLEVRRLARFTGAEDDADPHRASSGLVLALTALGHHFGGQHQLQFHRAVVKLVSVRMKTRRWPLISYAVALLLLGRIRKTCAGKAKQRCRAMLSTRKTSWPPRWLCWANSTRP